MSKSLTASAVGSISAVLVVGLLAAAPAVSATGTLPSRAPSDVGSPVPSQSEKKQPYSDLSGVTALSATDAWAVGIAGPGPTRYAITEHWDGTSWNLIPNAGANGTYLKSVSAVSTSDVWAVGTSGGGRLPFIEHWDGSAWAKIAAAPVPLGSWFSSVSAVSTNDVWVVGGHFSPMYKTRTLVEHWDGTSWTQVPCPSPGPGYHGSALTGVSAVSSDDVWAVGEFEPGKSPRSRPLIVHWDGTTWSRVPNPSPGDADDSSLLSVSAGSASDVWAVGFNAGTSKSSLVEHWEGTSWAIVPSPNPGGGYGGLRGVTSVSTTDAWAVGQFTGAETGHPRPLNIHWDGTSWTRARSSGPNGSYGSTLYGVAATSATDAWAVGGGTRDRLIEPIIQHWDGTAWTTF